ncbi:MAG: TetR family transcriptional regulator [Alphaproteobacteria bacterium]|nr:TetR family transcriptional regulator [Alphaproteobacteria bacterium]
MTDAPDAPTAGDDADRSVSRGEARRAAFMDAALDVFLEQGYESASVNEVVRRAGGSLATLYQQFGSKEGLFLAVARAATERFVAPMALAAGADGTLEQGLQAIGEHYLDAMMTPRGLAFFRIMIGEGRKFPPVMQEFLRTGPERVRAIVAAFLIERAPREGVAVAAADSDALASMFCELVRGRHQYRGLANPDYQLSEDDIAAHVRLATHVFLNGVRPR